MTEYSGVCGKGELNFVFSVFLGSTASQKYTKIRGMNHTLTSKASYHKIHCLIVLSKSPLKIYDRCHPATVSEETRSAREVLRCAQVDHSFRYGLFSGRVLK